MRRDTCFLCGAGSGAPVKNIPEYVVCQCGLVRRIGREDLMEYSFDYFTNEDPTIGHRDFESDWARRYDEARFERELRDVGRVGAGSALLDFGSATGSFLSIAAGHGWNGVGVEISQAAREIAAKRGVKSYPTLTEAAGDGPFELITLHHVLEHVLDPISTLVDLSELLADDGQLLIEVPNWRSLERRTRGRSWIDLRPEQHEWHFDPSTLVRTCRRAGLEVLSCTSRGEPLPSIGSLASTLGLPDRLLTAAGGWKRRASGAMPGATSAVSTVDVPSVRRRALAKACWSVERSLDLGRFGKRLVVVTRRSRGAGPTMPAQHQQVER